MAHGIPFQDIEKKWQAIWEKDQVYRAMDPSPKFSDPSTRPTASLGMKFYGLIEFPYPSGEGLHVGHPRSYTAIDIVTRKKRMEGKNVLYPIGWDAFGLPTENFAIKNKIKPQNATTKNIANFTRQLKSLGFGFDWSREVNTTDPAYYKWTQWMFLKLYNSHFDDIDGRVLPIDELAIPDDVGARLPRLDRDAAIRSYIDSHRMAYKAETKIHWCPQCKIGLAKEEAQGGVCERCGTPVEERRKSQWMIRITKYADRLIADLDTVDYLEKIKTQQINWIGKSEGALVNFQVESRPSSRAQVEGKSIKSKVEEKIALPDKLTVFTTRPDTLFGATFLVVSPEVAKTWIDAGWKADEKVKKYVEKSLVRTEIDRMAEGKEKTGIDAKITAKNPATGEQIPIWIADYVLGNYGTGAIMAVPAHDERDFEFAKKFGLPIRIVVNPPTLQFLNINVRDRAAGIPSEIRVESECWIGEGIAINSDFLNGLATSDAKEKIIEWLEANNVGKRKTMFKLRDWVFSRQRYWGEPIPIVICKTCGFVPVPEKELPLLLPDVDAYEPTDTGESPLAKIRDWVEVACPTCGGAAERETDTMPNWAGSSWYFLRYCDPHNDKVFADPEKLRYWMPVDLYNGGMEHTTLHLLYSRFWYKVLWDLGHVPRECGSEPYKKRRSHALILGEGGVKMSKSKGNVVNPDDVVEKYGADVFRVYEMFIGPFDADAPWDTNGIEGVKRFLEKIWKMSTSPPSPSPSLGEGVTSAHQNPLLTKEGAGGGNLELLLHQTIKKVGDDIEAMRFNTAVSAMMIFVNATVEQVGAIHDLPLPIAESFLKLLAPFAPHLAEELWHKLGHATTIHREPWPTYDPNKIIAETFELVVQVNGKVRDRMTVASGITEKEATNLALASEKVQRYLVREKPKKVVYIKGRLISISV